MRFTSPIFRFLAIASMILALGASGLPGIETCLPDAGHGIAEAESETHCLCAHGQGSGEIPGSWANAVADCGSGCACVPARSGWQSNLTSRVKEESRDKDSLAQAFTAQQQHFYKPAQVRSHAPNPGQGPPLPSLTLVSLRTIVLLT